jgi:hypothetical protein
LVSEASQQLSILGSRRNHTHSYAEGSRNCSSTFALLTLLQDHAAAVGDIFMGVAKFSGDDLVRREALHLGSQSKAEQKNRQLRIQL